MEVTESLQDHLPWRGKGKNTLEVCPRDPIGGIGIGEELELEERNWRQKYRQFFQGVLP